MSATKPLEPHAMGSSSQKGYGVLGFEPFATNGMRGNALVGI